MITRFPNANLQKLARGKKHWLGKFAAFLFAMFSSDLTATAQAPPIITTQPVSQTNWAGASVAFSVIVEGTGPFTYQWQFDGTNLPTQNNIITTVAGNARESAFSGDGGTATNAAMLEPSGVAINTAGDILIVDQWNNRIREVNTGGIINTVAGIGPIATPGNFSGDGGKATNAGLNLPAWYVVNNVMYDLPAGVAVDKQEGFYIDDAGNNRIRLVDTNGIITTIAGTNSAGFFGDGGLAVNAGLKSPSGVAVDNSGNLYIADEGNEVIRKVNTDGIITTVAGNGSTGYSGDGGPATYASLNHPYSVAVDVSGNFFIADEGNNVIRKVNTNGIITTVVGNGRAGYSGDGGAATNASLSQPYGVAVDTFDDIFIADYGNNRIRMVEPNRTITTVAGSGTAGHSGDGGVATNANIFEPAGVGVDHFGNLFFSENYYSNVRKVNLGRDPVLKLDPVTLPNAGNYAVIISSPYGSVTSRVVALTVYSPPIVQPPYQAVEAGSNIVFTAFANGTPVSSYQWQFNGTNIVWATNATLILTDVQTANEGNYAVVTSNYLGSITSSNALLFDWSSVLGGPGLDWSSNPAWFPETIVSLDGSAAQSGSLPNGGLSTLQTSVTGPGTLTFWWMFSPRLFPPYNLLSFSTSQSNISVSVSSTSGWQQNTFYLGAGTQTLRWTYSRSIHPIIGQSTGFVDQVSFVPGGTAPVITSAPTNALANMSANVMLAVSAVGTPQLSYQWLFNNKNMPGQTSAILSLPNVQPSNSGNYRVEISNAYGTVETNVTLSVQPFEIVTGSADPRVTTNGFQLEVTGIQSAQPIIVMSSTNLVDWFPVFTNGATTGSIQFIDFTATNLPVRFYRAREQ